MNSYDYFVKVYNRQGRIIDSDDGIFNRIDEFISKVENYFDRYKDEVYLINLSIRNRTTNDFFFYDKDIHKKDDVYKAVRALT